MYHKLNHHKLSELSEECRLMLYWLKVKIAKNSNVLAKVTSIVQNMKEIEAKLEIQHYCTHSEPIPRLQYKHKNKISEPSEIDRDLLNSAWIHTEM